MALRGEKKKKKLMAVGNKVKKENTAFSFHSGVFSHLGKAAVKVAQWVMGSCI